MRLSSLVLALLLLGSSVDAAPRRRAVAIPAPGPNESTPAGWLAANAHVLKTVDLVPDTSDLFPLHSLVGSAAFVALGDGTHGTHEFYTVKLRVLDYLVRDMNFEVLAVEAPFPLMNRIDAYVQGGPGDARAMLHEMYALTYFFWDAEEIVDVVEWMRTYNAHRGDRPPIHIAGFDVTQPNAASNAVLTYLRAFDPVAAVDAEDRYSCARDASLTIDANCQARAIKVRDALLTNESELTNRSSATAFAEALHNANVVVQSRSASGSKRDESMAQNALWLADHRGTNGKMVLWAHSAHLSEAPHPWTGNRPMGRWLAEALGPDFFTITTLTAAGTYRQWTETFDGFTQTFPPPAPASYESYIRQSGQQALLIPFRNSLPEWLTEPAAYHAAGVNGGPTITGALAEQYDAAIFIDTTTAMLPIAP